jgi:hypothetical protein
LFRNNSSVIEVIDEFISKDINYKTFKDPDELFNLAIVIFEFCFDKKYPKSHSLSYFKKFKNYEELDIYIKESKDKELETANKMQKRYQVNC